MSRYDDLIRDSTPSRPRQTGVQNRVDKIKRFDVKERVVDDVLKPGALDFVSDMASSIIEAFAETALAAVDIIIWGEESERKRGGYNSIYDTKRRKRRGSSKRSTIRTDSSRKDVYDYKEFPFDSREDAEEVRNDLKDILRQYEVVSVADFYRHELVNLDYSHADEKFGWEDLGAAYVSKGRGGKYYLNLPKAREIT